MSVPPLSVNSKVDVDADGSCNCRCPSTCCIPSKRKHDKHCEHHPIQKKTEEVAKTKMGKK